jgi:hypothetical protein
MQALEGSATAEAAAAGDVGEKKYLFPLSERVISESI